MKANSELMYCGNSLPDFLIGSQIFVATSIFLVACAMSLHYENMRVAVGASEGIQAFHNTCLLGALNTAIIGSLSWHLVASSFLGVFLSNPEIYINIHACLILKMGICSAS